MKLLLEFLVVTNLALFIINCMFAGVSFAQGLLGPMGFFAFVALVHGSAADYFKRVKEKKYPSDSTIE